MKDLLSSEKYIYFDNPVARQHNPDKAVTDDFSSEIAVKVRKFHQAIPDYQPTPLVQLGNLAEYLGVGEIWVKDESHRFGLNAFKVLGGAYALSSVLAEQLGVTKEVFSFSDFQSPDIQDHLAGITCITATDGNHGRGVAWSAQQLGCRSVVYMPKGSAACRLQNIQRCGADASIIDGPYDDAVRLAAEHAKENGWLLIQDTVQPGYEAITLMIMQGYLTMYEEAFEQLGTIVPTHIFAQCGIGSLPASFQAYLVQKFGMERPFFTIVEPAMAACFLESAVAQDGKPHKSVGSLDTIMAGLACGEPSILSWNIARDHTDLFVACQDDVAMKGMRVLGNPMKWDQRVISGESGAVTLGLLHCLMKDPDFAPLKGTLDLNDESEILLLSTEGDTDPNMYRKIVWGE